MPINNSRSARAYRRGEALKRRLNDLQFWSNIRENNPEKALVIRDGKACDPAKKIERCQIDIDNTSVKQQTRLSVPVDFVFSTGQVITEQVVVG